MGKVPYRRTVEALLDHGQFARALARCLVRGNDAADDLVQDAWVAAMENPPDQGGRGWLRAEMRNLAANRWRGARRREERVSSVRK